MLDALARDLRFAARSLSRTPTNTFGALLSIALGIAASTAVFSVVDAAIFRPPPFHDVDRLAMIYATRSDAGEVPEPGRWS
jgi:putative ABC transport system permease protein